MISEKITKNSLVDIPRLEKLIEFLDQVKDLMGDNAEVGVYKGGTAYLIASHSKNPLYLFDTFQGMPEPDPNKDKHKYGDFSDTDLYKVSELLGEFYPVEISKGIFPKETGTLVENNVFRFVHLDCDLYKSVKESLEFFYPRMVVGGIIVLDDYNEEDCPGAKLATDEFLSDKPESIFSRCQSQVAIKKGFYEQSV